MKSRGDADPSLRPHQDSPFNSSRSPFNSSRRGVPLLVPRPQRPPASKSKLGRCMKREPRKMRSECERGGKQPVDTVLPSVVRRSAAPGIHFTVRAQRCQRRLGSCRLAGRACDVYFPSMGMRSGLRASCRRSDQKAVSAQYLQCLGMSGLA